MKRCFPLICLIAILTVNFVLPIAIVNAASSLKIVILCFDDGRISHYNIVLPLLTSYGIKATFFVIPNVVGTKPAYANNETLMSWEQIKTIANNGHEIGSHSVAHVLLNQDNLAKEALIYQLEKSKAFIYGNISYAPVSFAYPGGDYNLTVLSYVKQYYQFARTIDWDNDWRAGEQIPGIFNRDRLSFDGFRKLPSAVIFHNGTNSSYPGSGYGKQLIDQLVSSSSGNTVVFSFHTILADSYYNPDWTFADYETAGLGTMPITRSHLQEIIEYGISKGVKFTSVRDALQMSYTTKNVNYNVYSLATTIVSVAMLAVVLAFLKKVKPA